MGNSCAHPGNVVLSVKPMSNAWADFFAFRDQTEVPADFMRERPLNEPMQPRRVFEDH
jgi:hypothetical protein